MQAIAAEPQRTKICHTNTGSGLIAAKTEFDAKKRPKTAYCVIPAINVSKAMQAEGIIAS
eukprot:gene4330-7624_t